MYFFFSGDAFESFLKETTTTKYPNSRLKLTGGSNTGPENDYEQDHDEYDDDEEIVTKSPEEWLDRY